MSPVTDLGPPRRVLVIEDYADGREALRILLELLGHRVDVAADGSSGVCMALAAHPDVVIIDVGLPGLDGFEVGRRLRTGLGGSVVLIAYTAYDDQDTCRRVVDAGFDAHLVKPVWLSDLVPWLEARAGAPNLPRIVRADPPVPLGPQA